MSATFGRLEVDFRRRFIVVHPVSCNSSMRIGLSDAEIAQQPGSASVEQLEIPTTCSVPGSKCKIEQLWPVADFESKHAAIHQYQAQSELLLEVLELHPP